VKEIVFKDGHKITTPWLRSEEAAAYCGLAKSSFYRKATGVPFGGSGSQRMYHVDVLDDWMAGKLEVPFEPEGKSGVEVVTDEA